MLTMTPFSAELHRPLNGISSGPRRTGFTLIEMMIAVAVIAILIRIVAPTLRDVVLNARMAAQASTLMVDLATARSEAVHRSTRVAICTSSTGVACTNTSWDQGWLLFVDKDLDGKVSAGEQVLKVSSALHVGNTLIVSGDAAAPGGGRYVPYRPSGAVFPDATSAVTFQMCDERTKANVGDSAAQDKGRLITISNAGRPVVSRITCN